MAKSLEQQKFEQAITQMYNAGVKAYIREERNTIRYAETCIDFLEGTKDVKFISIIKYLHDIINKANLMIEIYKAKLIDL